MIGSIIYLLCAFTSLGAALLLWRGYRRSRQRLLYWSSLCFAILAASNGREAVELYARRRRDVRLVVLDMTMPHMDGEATFRALRKIDPGAQIVVSSGYSKQEVAAQFAGQGLAGFVQKPYKTDDLLGKIRDLLR